MKRMRLVSEQEYQQCFTPPPSAEDIMARMVQQKKYMRELEVKNQPQQVFPLSDEWTKSLTPKYQATAKQLMSHIKDNPHIFQFNARKELIFNGTPISDSNGEALLYELLKGQSQGELLGMPELMEMLRRSEVPRGYINNKKLATIIYPVKETVEEEAKTEEAASQQQSPKAPTPLKSPKATFAGVAKKSTDKKIPPTTLQKEEQQKRQRRANPIFAQMGSGWRMWSK